ncbi:MAG: heavy-metal-associated domain-containing protein [Longimicrobiales bacterium]
MNEVQLKITGMSCDHCVRAVTGALERVDGVESADVDLDRGRAMVRYDESRTGPRELVGAVMDEGYTAEEATS